MATVTSALDQTSRNTIARFGTKVAVAFLLALFIANHLIAMASWLSLFGLIVAATAFIFRQGFSPSSFTFCDEALWLMAVSHGLRLAHLWTA